MQLYTTKADVFAQHILPALGEYAEDYDVDGIFLNTFKFDDSKQAFYQEVSSEKFWEIVEDNHFELFVEWSDNEGENNATWQILTPALERDGDIHESGSFESSDNRYKSHYLLAGSVRDAGYIIGDNKDNGPGYSTYEVSRGL